MKQITFTRTYISPKIAAELLKRNKVNRPLRNHIIAKYANDIAAGRWLEGTGETVKIDIDDNILDGQHRLLAIIKCGIGLWLYVSTGHDREVFKVLDTGQKRTASDVFSINKIGRSNSLPSMIQSYFNLSKSKSNKRGGSSSLNLSNSELLEFYELDSEHWDYICRESYSWYASFAKILPPSLIGGLFALFYEIDKKDSHDFMNQLCTGIDVKNRMVGLLRTKLMQDKMAPRKLPHLDKIALILKTWNMFRTGKELLFLKYDSERESFPTII